VGVPLYKVYKRNSSWRREVAPLTDDEENNNEVYNYKHVKRESSLLKEDSAKTTTNNGVSIVDEALGLDSNRKKTNFKLEKDDSIEELVKAIRAPRNTINGTCNAKEINYPFFPI